MEKLNQDSRVLLKNDMGHGPDRNDVVSIYVGSAQMFVWLSRLVGH